jgi:tripartite-type tricarboxylate transporter receptor subunit TctC
MMFDEVPSVAPNVLAGQVRALGVTGKTRSKALPDVPTVAETVPGYEHTGWFGIMAPTGTPKPIVDRLNEAIRAIVAKPEVQAYWEKQDTQTMSMTPAESEAFIKADIEKWTKVVKAANIKLE